MNAFYLFAFIQLAASTIFNIVSMRPPPSLVRILSIGLHSNMHAYARPIYYFTKTNIALDIFILFTFPTVYKHINMPQRHALHKCHYIMCAITYRRHDDLRVCVRMCRSQVYHVMFVHHCCTLCSPLPFYRVAFFSLHFVSSAPTQFFVFLSFRPSVIRLIYVLLNRIKSTAICSRQCKKRRKEK